MNVIDLYVQFNNLAAFLLRKGSDAIGHFPAYLSGQNLESVFGNPYNMVLAMPYCV
jgi:hypothetical protein